MIPLSRTLALAFALLIISAIAVAAEPTILTGTVTHVRDGDTIEVGKIPIRLNGIDAPETRQECFGRDGGSYGCGEASTDSLRILVGSEPVRCEGNGEGGQFPSNNGQFSYCGTWVVP